MNPPPYLPFSDRQWRMTPGLAALDLATWIEIDECFTAELALKEQLLQERHSEVFASLPGSETAQAEVLELLLVHLQTYFPHYYNCQPHQIHNLVTGKTWQIPDFATAPLDLAGRLVQEDLCLLQPDSSGHKLVAASVCFPSRWCLADKIGRCLGQIHTPVPGYAEKLETPLDRFFAQLKVDRPVWRLNWGIADSSDYFLIPNPNPEQLSASINAINAGEKLWLRVERQTLRRLPQTNYILFTIRTYIHPLKILAAYPKAAQGLANILHQLPIATQQYKSLASILPIVTAYLAQLNFNNPAKSSMDKSG
jgi:dimethylamine monooxygenase subunit A